MSPTPATKKALDIGCHRLEGEDQNPNHQEGELIMSSVTDTARESNCQPGVESENHVIRGYDIELAMIEGTEIVAECGATFVPSVTVGTSGRADVPGAPLCDVCDELKALLDERRKLRIWRDWLERQINAGDEEYRRLSARSRERALEDISA